MLRNPSLPANALGNNSVAINWPEVRAFGDPLDFVQLDVVPVVQRGLWEGVFNFFDCLRFNYPQFDIMWANGAPVNQAKTTYEAYARCDANSGGQNKKRFTNCKQHTICMVINEAKKCYKN